MYDIVLVLWSYTSFWEKAPNAPPVKFRYP